MRRVPDVVIRSLHDLPETSACIELQRRVWGFADIDVVPDAVFMVAAKTGGQVLGAFRGESLIGFALSFSAQAMNRTYLHSHMVAVLPDCQNQGIGRLLKLAQRQEALARAIDLIEWTFDPLQIKNAHFNIARLGAVVRRYIPNCYGRTSSPLHGGLPTDRLVAEWWLRSKRVQARVVGNYQEKAGAGEQIAVPSGVHEVYRKRPHEAEKTQQRVRASFESAFAKGYSAVGFKLDKTEGIYLMEPYED